MFKSLIKKIGELLYSLMIEPTEENILDNTYELWIKKDETNDNIQSLIYFDFETTGLNPYYDKIIEYAFIKENGQPQDNMNRHTDYITSLVNPNQPLSSKITQITHITDSMLENKQPINKKIILIKQFIMGEDVNYLVAHNAIGFDKLFLHENLKLLKNVGTNKLKYIDTLLLAKKLIPNLNGGYSMYNLSKYYDIKSGNHRAINDTLALRLLFHKLLATMEEQCINTKHNLMSNPQLILNYLD
jgi:DNA polymerase-3 subunit alpha (Gram-positive type)